MGETALSIKGNTFQFFSRNPRGGQAKKIDPADAQALIDLAKTNNFAPLLVHAPYTINMCSSNKDTRDFARMAFADDLERLQYLPDNYYNFHPGSHVGQGVETGIAQITEIMNACIRENHHTTILLETMSGKGTEVGRSFEEIKAIIDKVELADKIGVCLDTCHVYSAGYDIVNKLDQVLAEFEQIIGLDRLKAIHLNDSMTPFNSKKDRHAPIGEGHIGFAALVEFITHPLLRDLPFYLETPQELPGYAREIKMLRQAYQEILGE